MAWHLVRFAGKEAIHWVARSSPPSTPEESVEVEVLEADDHRFAPHWAGRTISPAGNTGRIERVTASQLLCPDDDVSLLCRDSITRSRRGSSAP